MELLKNFQVKDIIISTDYRNTLPGIAKMERAEQRYLQEKTLPTNIVINDENILIDGYIVYLLAVEYGITEIDVYRGHAEIIEAVHSADSIKKYKWRVPSRLIGTIEVNDRVLVSTSTGIRCVRVTDVIRQQYPDQNVGKKQVVKKCKAR